MKINFSDLPRCRNDVDVLNKFDSNRVSILIFKKHAFADRVFTLNLQKITNAYARIFSDITNSLATNFIDSIAEDFYYDLSKVSEIFFLDVFKDHAHMINKPANTSGSLIYNIYIKKALMVEFLTKKTVETFIFQIMRL